MWVARRRAEEKSSQGGNAEVRSDHPSNAQPAVAEAGNSAAAWLPTRPLSHHVTNTDRQVASQLSMQPPSRSLNSTEGLTISLIALLVLPLALNK